MTGEARADVPVHFVTVASPPVSFRTLFEGFVASEELGIEVLISNEKGRLEKWQREQEARCHFGRHGKRPHRYFCSRDGLVRGT